MSDYIGLVPYIIFFISILGTLLAKKHFSKKNIKRFIPLIIMIFSLLWSLNIINRGLVELKTAEYCKICSPREVVFLGILYMLGLLFFGLLGFVIAFFSSLNDRK